MKVTETREFRLEESGLSVVAIGPINEPPDSVQISRDRTSCIVLHCKEIPHLVALLDTMHRKLARWAVGGSDEK
jgi:hypothetical protein